MVERLDATGRACPVPVLMLARRIKALPAGAIVEVISDDRSFVDDVAAWCEHHGHRVVAVDDNGLERSVRVEKRVAG